jgi:hypothetical protein
VFAPPIYALTTPELKRARISAADLRRIADDVAYATDPASHADHRSFEDIANGNLLTSRTRRTNQGRHRAFIDVWVDLEEEPMITKRGLRKRNRMATPCTPIQPFEAGVHDGGAAQQDDNRKAGNKKRDKTAGRRGSTDKGSKRGKTPQQGHTQQARKRKNRGQTDQQGLNTYDDNG